MSSHDPSKTKQNTARSTGAESGNPSKSDDFFDIDPAEIDRYLVGREPRSQGGRGDTRGARSRTAGAGTARQLEQLQQSVTRANRNRRPSESPPPPSTGDYDDPAESDPPDSTRGRQTAYAATPESPRANRRKRVKWRDPYVDEVDTLPAESPYPTYEDPITTASSYPDDESYDDDDTAEQYVEESRPTRQPARRSPSRTTRKSFQRPNIQRPTLPTSIARADMVNDAAALTLIGISLLSLVLMAIVVANRIGALNPVIATHISASGIAGGFASRTTIWHLPLLASMLTLMNLVAAWFISPLDRFASRFLLATSVVAQFVAWVALLRILW